MVGASHHILGEKIVVSAELCKQQCFAYISSGGYQGGDAKKSCDRQRSLRNIPLGSLYKFRLLSGAQLPWVWEYKRKQKKIPGEKREKKKKVGFSGLLLHFLLVKISEIYHKIYCLLYHFSIILLVGEK